MSLSSAAYNVDVASVPMYTARVFCVSGHVAADPISPIIPLPSVQILWLSSFVFSLSFLSLALSTVLWICVSGPCIYGGIMKGVICS